MVSGYVLDRDRWAPDDFFLEREYGSFAELASELEARQNDIDFMKAMRESYKHVVQGSVQLELFETPPPI